MSAFGDLQPTRWRLKPVLAQQRPGPHRSVSFSSMRR